MTRSHSSYRTLPFSVTPLFVRYCLSVAIAITFMCGGCKRTRSVETNSQSNPPLAATVLPHLDLRDESKDLLLTWLDNEGDFHVARSFAEVPVDSRERVRVVVTTSEAGNADPVYVADLRERTADGSYSVTTMRRAAWEELGAVKRKARIETMAPSTAQLAANQPQPLAAAETVKLAIIYGAKWCGACRQAKKYLSQKGVKVLEKDVDESATVQAELRAKLTKAGMSPTSSIPIIDIGGRIIVGFSQGAIDAAIKQFK